MFARLLLSSTVWRPQLLTEVLRAVPSENVLLVKAPRKPVSMLVQCREATQAPPQQWFPLLVKSFSAEVQPPRLVATRAQLTWVCFATLS